MLQNVQNNILLEEPVGSFIINGDPGCDGYNTEAVIILEESLKIPADFLIIAGDLVPTGNERYFKQFADIVNSNASQPVYCIPGNHDLPDYSDFCGKRDYYIEAPNALIIMLDNSRRYFSDETVAFLETTLAEHPHENTFIFFHIPVPNSIVPNHVSHEEWDKLKTAMTPYKANIQALFCGHVHSAFEFNIDGFRVIVTGGGGSWLDPVENTFFEKNIHHIVKIEFNDSNWHHQMIPLNHLNYQDAFQDCDDNSQIMADLEEGFEGEACAYRKYLIFSELAEEEGYPGIAKVFRAASESEFFHSQNMYFASTYNKSTKANLKLSIAREGDEVNRLYPEFIENTTPYKTKRAFNAYDCALHAEKIHHRLFSEALEALQQGKDIPEKNIFTCKRCGYTHAGDKPPSLCPACGTDRFKFKVVE